MRALGRAVLVLSVMTLAGCGPLVGGWTLTIAVLALVATGCARGAARHPTGWGQSQRIEVATLLPEPPAVALVVASVSVAPPAAPALQAAPALPAPGAQEPVAVQAKPAAALASHQRVRVRPVGAAPPASEEALELSRCRSMRAIPSWCREPAAEPTAGLAGHPAERVELDR